MAKMSRFYGLTPAQIDEMDVDMFAEYWQAITPIEASEQLLNIQSTTFIDMKKEDRNKVHKKLCKACNPRFEDGSQTFVTKEDIANILKEVANNG